MGQIILWSGGEAVLCLVGMLNSFPGLYPLYTSSTFFPTVTSNGVSRHWQMSLGGKGQIPSPPPSWLKTTGPDHPIPPSFLLFSFLHPKAFALGLDGIRAVYCLPGVYLNVIFQDEGIPWLPGLSSNVICSSRPSLFKIANYPNNP